MKSKITLQEARRLNAYKFSYCEIQYLLRYEDPVFYTCGIYWRKADFYRLEDPDTWKVIRISTWYAPTGERIIDYETAHSRDCKARDFDYTGFTAFETRKLLRSFIFTMIACSQSPTNT